MTRRPAPTPAAGGDVVEIDAMDGMEWEQGQRTPQANDANLAALVRETANGPAPVAPEPPRTARGRVTASVIPQRPRAGDTATQSAQPAARSAPPSGMEPLPRLFDDVTDDATHDEPRRVDASPTVPGSPSSLNDILRAPARPVWADSATPPAGLPLRAPVASARNPAALVVTESAPSPSEAPATTEHGGRLGSAAWRRLLLVIGGTAGLAVLVIALVVMTGGTSGEHPTSPPVDDHVQGPAAPAQAVAAVPVAPSAKPVAAPARPAELPAPEPPASRVRLALAPGSGPRVAASEPGRRSVRKLGGKKLVVDYSTRTSEPAMPGLVARLAEDPAIGLARTAYLSGNQQLFVGDAEGAIRAYRESLDRYPGYVGGYRGLGLAYAQLGDSRNALEAFKMYVATVPNARDVALIKKRIARLQGK